jgi:hypothetical protein
MINVGGIIADLQVEDKTSEAFNKAESALARIGSEIKRLDSLYQSNNIGLRSYARNIQSLTEAQEKLGSAMKAAFDSGAASAIGRVNSKLGGEGKTAASQFAGGLMQVGYVIDDLQYSTMAAVNNIAPLIIAFGGGMGLAGAMQVTAVAASQLYQNWDRMAAMFGDTSGIDRARETVSGMKEEVERLTIAIDTMGHVSWNPFSATKVNRGDADKLQKEKDRLRMLGEAGEAGKAMEAGPTEVEKKARERFQGIVSERGGIDAIANRIADQHFKDAGPEAFLNTEDIAKLRKAKEYIKDPDTAKMGEGIGVALIEKAKVESRKSTRQWIERSSLSPEGRDEVATLLTDSESDNFARTGEMLSGIRRSPEESKKADKARLKAEEEAEQDRKQAQKEEDEQNREFRRDNLGLAKVLMPNLSTVAKNLQDGIDTGGIKADAARSGLAKRLEKAGMLGEHADLAAKDTLLEQSKVDPEQRRKRREQEREGRGRDAVERAREIMPGLDERVQGKIADVALGGGNFLQAAAMIKQELIDSGAVGSDEEASDAAMQLAKEGRKGLADRVRQEALRDSGSTSQTMAASDLARQAQGGVGSDSIGNKLDKQTEHLGELVKQGNNVLNIRID